MTFSECDVDEAVGGTLAHGVRAGSVAFKKGRVLSSEDVAALAQAGLERVVVARPDADDVGEDEAAAVVARAVAGSSVRVGQSFTGRANLYSQADGLLVVNTEAVDSLNSIDESITLATLPPFARVTARQILATVKIIPFAVPRSTLAKAVVALFGREVLEVARFQPHKAGLISTVLPGSKASVVAKNRPALDARLNAIGSSIEFEKQVPHETTAVAAALVEAERAGSDPILIFGASAITDRRDIIPAAIVEAGGRIEHFGMPVDPGNLLLIGELHGRKVVGLPSCARSPKLNGVDFVLCRLAAGLSVSRTDIAGMGVGGLLGEIPTRPQPREVVSEARREPRIGAIVLAAGMASRMGRQKLLEPVRNRPLVRVAAESATGSAANPVIVVTGNEADAVAATLRDLPISIVKNPEFAKGLSTSLKTGLKTLPSDCDGAIILLGDMPEVSSTLVNRLIAAFDPAEGRAICVATKGGKRGNPVLFARRFFPQIMELEGDVGARHLLSEYADNVVEVEGSDDGPLIDIDTQEALIAYRAR